MALPFPRPASLGARFSMARCVPDDIPQMVSVYLAAFQPTRFVYWWPSSAETMRRWNEARFRLRFRDPTDQQFKVVDDETGQIVAFARWRVPVSMKGLSEGFRTYADENEDAFDGPEFQWMREPPTGCNEELYHEFFAGIRSMSQKWNANSEKLDLSLLCTHPAYHRRGIGAALISSILAIADAEGFTTYLEALDSAVPVYERYGFRPVDQLVFEKTRTGQDEDATIHIMLRDPCLGVV